MRTDPTRYAERHRKFTSAAETEFTARAALDPNFVVADAILGLAVRVKLAIARRDCVSGILAAQAAHLAILGSSKETVLDSKKNSVAHRPQSYSQPQAGA
jgi:hypothetical protein